MDMKAILCLALSCIIPHTVSQCESGWTENGGFCYYLQSVNNRRESWHDAEGWCNTQGAYLASITSQQEQDVISHIAANKSHSGNLWIGYNKLSDRNGGFNWSDGSSTGYENWAGGQPNTGGDEHCAYAEMLVNTPSDCLSGRDGRNTVVGIINSPEEASPPDTFHFGSWPEDIEAQELCKQACKEVPECHSYTFVYNGAAEYPDLAGHCVGRSDKYDLDEPDFWCYSGSRVPCMSNYNISGLWYSSNCGVPQGYICKKPVSSGGPIPTAAPETVDSYCPQGYFNIANGNKCFKVFTTKHDNNENGKTWDEALELCRAGPGSRPDIASISSELENAEVLAALQDYVYGVWVGLYVDVRSESWVWADNSNPAYTNWDTSRPSGANKTCTEMWVSPGKPGTWSNLNCQEKRGYVCQTYKDQANLIPSPPNTSPFSCTSGYTPYWYACYKIHTGAKTWQEAEDVCVGEGSHLASIHTEMENSAVFAFTQSSAPIWIGFKKDENDVYHWSDNWISRYTNWASGGTEGGDGCVEMMADGTWKDVACGEVRNFTCKNSDNPIWTTPNLQEGYCPKSWISYGGNCYYFSEDEGEFTWMQAEAKCAEFAGSAFSGHLTSIHSHTEDQFIHDKLLAQGDSATWIGLNRTGTGNGFMWSDGSAVDFEFWAPGEPSQNTEETQCVEMSGSVWAGAWMDENCDLTKRNYVCISQKNPISTPTTTTFSPTTPVLPPTGSQQCPSEEWQKYDDMCFLFKHDTPVSWEAAVDACVTASGGKATLASIHSSTENWFLHDAIKSQSTNFWLGMYKEGPDECFDQVNGRSSISGVINSPGAVSPPDTFHFGEWGGSNDDSDGVAWCKGECAKIPECFSYTFNSIFNTDTTWAGHCHGISAELAVNVQDFWSYKGSRIPCTHQIASDNSYKWVDDSSIDYDNWDSSSDQGSLCVEMLADFGTWNDQNCGTELGYVCRWTSGGDHTMIPTEPGITTTTTTTISTTTTMLSTTTPGHASKECPDDTWNLWQDNCYWFSININHTWSDAQQHCASEQLNSNLTSIHSDDENMMIVSELSRINIDNAWTGLQRNADGLLFRWADESKVNYTHWGMGEPSGAQEVDQCAIISGYSLGNWYDEMCINIKPFVCKRPAETKERTQPQYQLIVTGNFQSSTGEDFSQECTVQYAGSMNQRAFQMGLHVNSLIGSFLCTTMTSDDMMVISSSSPMFISGNQGETSPTFFFALGPNLLITDVEGCAAEILAYLYPHTNWGEPIIPAIPGCPSILFADSQFTYDSDQWLCADSQVKQENQNEHPQIRISSPLNYGISHTGTFHTQNSESLDPDCLNLYNTDFSTQTYEMIQSTNSLITSGSLCSGFDISILTASAFLVAGEYEGASSQTYITQPASSMLFSQVYECADEISQHLALHENWINPIIPQIPGCPMLVFDPELFQESSQQWICV